MTMQDSEYVQLAEEAWKEALEIARSSDEWKEEKKDKKTVSSGAVAFILSFTKLLHIAKGDVVESRRNSAGRKIYR